MQHAGQSQLMMKCGCKRDSTRLGRNQGPWVTGGSVADGIGHSPGAITGVTDGHFCAGVAISANVGIHPPRKDVLARCWLSLAYMMGILRAFGAVFLNTTSGVIGSEKGQRAGATVERKSRGVVLVIDDDSATLEILRPLLRAEGFTVLAAQSAAKGLDMLRYCQEGVRLVVLDYNMPHLNGVETLAFLRKLNPRVKVLGLTGVETNLLPETFRCGVDKILTKPCRTSELIDTINYLLGFDPSVGLAEE